MPKGHLEHINITVSDIERSAALLGALMGWRIRWRKVCRKNASI